MQHTHRPKFTINTIMLCGIVLFALVVIPEISDSYAQETITASDATFTLYSENTIDITFADTITKSFAEDPVITFTLEPGLEVISSATESTTTPGEYTVTADPVRFGSTELTNDMVANIQYTASHPSGSPSDGGSYEVTINPGRAIVEGTIIRNFPVNQDISLHYTDFITTHRPFSEFNIIVKYSSTVHHDTILSVASGGDRLVNNAREYTMTDERIVFDLMDTTSRDSITFTIDVTVAISGQTLSDGSTSGSTFLITFLRDPTIIAPNIAIEVDQGTEDDLDFSTVVGSDPSDELTIVFDTGNSNAVGNILGNGTFSTMDVTSINATAFRVTATDGMVTFEANSNAIGGVYTIPYTATDAADNQSMNTITITILDITDPIVPDLVYYRNSNAAFVFIDFSDITDDTDSFDQLTIIFSPRDGANHILVLGGFHMGTNSSSVEPIKAISQNVIFLIGGPYDHVDTVPFIIPYTVTDRAGNSNDGVVNVFFDTSPPTASNFSVSVNPGESVDLDFFGNVTDTSSSFEQIIITFDTDDPAATPKILGNGTFSGVNGTTTPFRVTEQTVVFTANSVDVADAGVYTIPYIATDNVGRSSSATMSITIRDIIPPTAPPISVSVIQNKEINLDFSVATDNVGSIDTLIIVITPADDILVNGVFEDATVREDGNYDVDSHPVKFTANDDAELRTYTLSYQVSDAAGNESVPSPLVITIIDDTPPTAPILLFTVSVNSSVDFDFIGVDDDSAVPTIVLDTSGTDYAPTGNFTSGVSGTKTSLTIESQIVTFTALSTATHSEEIAIPYTVTDDAGQMASNTLYIYIEREDSPTTPNILVPTNQGTTSTVDFSAVTDDATIPSDLIIILYTTGTQTNSPRFVATGPEPLVDHFTFSGTEPGGTEGALRLLETDVRTLGFTISDTAPVGLYQLPYLVLDETLRDPIAYIQFVVMPKQSPTTPLITATIPQGMPGNLDFNAVSDDTTLFNDLIITFDTTVGATGGVLLEQGSFTLGDTNSTDTPPFLVTASDGMVEFTTDDDAVPGTYSFIYNATDADGNSDDGTVNVIITDITPPTASTSSITLNPGDTRTLDFSTLINDNVDSSESLSITINTAGTGAIGDILSNGVFSVDGTPISAGVTSFTATGSMAITFMANPDASSSLRYMIPYTVTDSAGNESSNVLFTIIIDDNVPPIANPISFSVARGQSVPIDFSVATDNSDPPENLTFAILTADGILANGEFTGVGVRVINPSRISIDSLPVMFAANTNAELRTYTLSYEAYDDTSNQSVPGPMTITITADTTTPEPPTDTTPPTTPNITDTIIQGTLGALDFSIVGGDADPIEQLTITFDTTVGANGKNILAQGSFPTGANDTDTSPFLVTASDGMVEFMANSGAVPDTYPFTYTATDAAGNPANGIATIIIEATPLANTIKPITPDLIYTARSNVAVDIDFSGVSDNLDTLDALEITLDFNSQNVTGPASILAQGDFTNISDSGDRRTVTQPVTFTATGTTLGQYSFTYVATDSDGNSNSGRITLVLPRTDFADTTAPITPLITGIVNRDEVLNLDLSGVSDNISNTDLSVTFDTDNPSRTGGNILEHGSFTTNVAGDNGPSFTVRNLGETVQFTPDSDAVLGTYTFPYTATDESGNTATNNVSVRIGVGLDTIPPTTPSISSMITLGANGTIDFSGVTDNPNSFDDLTITFDTNDPRRAGNILAQGSFADGVTVSGTTHTVISQMVIFTANFDASRGTYSVPYTATDSTGNMNSDSLEIEFIPDTTIPTIPTIDITSTITQGTDGTLDPNGVLNFTGIIDNIDSFEQLTITFDTRDAGATPKILGNGTFTAGVNGTTTPFEVTSDDGLVQFTANDDAMVGDYSIPYVVTDRAENRATGTATMTIKPDTDAPTTPNLTLSLIRGAVGNIDFSGVTDNKDAFGILKIVLNTNHTDATPGILDNISFTAGVNGTTTPFLVESEIVVFTVNTNAVLGAYTIPYNATDVAGNFGSENIIITIEAVPPVITTAEPAPQPRRSGGGGGSSGGGGGGGSGGSSSILNIDSFAPHLVMYDQCSTDGKVRVVASSQSNNLQASIVSNAKTYTGIDVTDRVDTSMYITTTSASPFIFDFETEKLNSFVIKMSIDSSSGISYPVNVTECISHKKLFSNAGVNIATPSEPYFEFGKTRDTSAPESNDTSQTTESVLKQYNRGVPIDQIVCQDSTNTLLESPSGKPYCMTDQSSLTLIDRGYTLV